MFMFFFLTKTYLYPSFVIWDSCLYPVLSHYFDRKECFYTTFDIQGSVLWKIVCLDRRVCTQVLRLRTTDHEEDWQQQPRRTSDHHDWPRQSRRLTMKNDSARRLTTNFVHFRLKIWHLVATIFNNFLRMKWPNLLQFSIQLDVLGIF